MYTFEVREGRFLSVYFGGQGGRSWEIREIGGCFGGMDMVCEVFEELLVMGRVWKGSSELWKWMERQAA